MKAAVAVEAVESFIRLKPRNRFVSALKSFLCIAVAVLPPITGAVPFQNLGFEDGNFDPARPPLDAGLEERYLPGWQNSIGLVGYNYTQSFSGFPSLLSHAYRNTTQPANLSKPPIVGQFSLGIWPVALGGDFPFTLRQTGDVPAGSQSLRFLYEGNNLTVYVGGSPMMVHRLEDRPSGDPEIGDLHYFAVDVSPFAGQTAELRFDFRSFGNPPIDGPPIPGLPDAKMHVLDDLSFSPLPAVPEPPTWALFGVGLGAMAWRLCGGAVARSRASLPKGPEGR